MRWPTCRNRRRVIRLPGHLELRAFRYSFEGERYVLQQASWSTDGDMQLSLVTEASFIVRNEIHEQRRGLVDLLRRRRSNADN
jgi:hypothetical protein